MGHSTRWSLTAYSFENKMNQEILRSMAKLNTRLLNIRTTTNQLKTFPNTRRISTNTEPSSQPPFPSSSSSTIKKKGSRLRDRAGLPAFEGTSKHVGVEDHYEKEGSGDSQPADQNQNHQTFTPMKPWNMRTRNQLERTQMNHRESQIALELLEDLAIPLDELLLNTTTQNDPKDHQDTSESGKIKDLLHRPEFQSILSQHSSSSSHKNLERHRPTQLSAEDLRIEDILKELSDSLLRKIDSFQNDFELLTWLDHQVFSQSRIPSSSSSSSRTTTADNCSSTDSNDTHNKLGQVFESLDSHPSILSTEEYELDLNFQDDPERILRNRPICYSPLFSSILVHLLQTFSSRFQNAHLSLYLFDWVRSHPDPLVKYFGLTRDVYFEVVTIKWEIFQDFRGIQNEMVEMKALGLDLDDRFKRLIQSITQLVLDDEIQAEQRLALQSSTAPLNPSDRDKYLDRFRRISPTERLYVSQIESLLNQFIDSQNQAFTHKFRAPPPSHHHP
ncbi:hypothetical protein PGT21_005308 [Puccinia graminis f. sp. tritici]|uniref:Mtf2-like C-terminal domain-containing protein n=2 Tax=Puccinia graminis f. sp. tritici TaxID=56615 RepID=A0A5B0Q1V3_PUCGR|nr:hypothetical protein PGT21_005308 [Puccinia graminis f. sp. tritici]